MNLTEFAEKNGLKLKRDKQDDTVIILGHKGKSHAYEYGEGLLGVMVMPEVETSHWWTAARKAFLAAGMRIRQNGDFEGAATFDPRNPEQVKVALKYAGVRRRRGMSLAQRESLTKARTMVRPANSVEAPVAEAVLPPRSEDQGLGSGAASS
jgi:hypothetical protein